MSTHLPAFRATVYAPRSVDATEATILAPAAGAPHSESFKVCTVSGLAGWKPILGMPTGRRGGFNALTKRTDTGSLTLELLDARVGTDNLERWLTAFTGDAKGRPALNGCKVKVERCLDWDGSSGTWASWWTGRIEERSLQGRLWNTLLVHDFSGDQAMKVFDGRPHSSITYASFASFLPIGMPAEYGGMVARPPLDGTFTNAPSLGTRASFGFTVAAAHLGWVSGNIITQALAKVARQADPSSPNLLVFNGGTLNTDDKGDARARITVGASTYEAHVVYLRTGRGGNGQFFAEEIGLANLTASDPLYVDLATLNGQRGGIRILIDLPASKDNRMYVRNVHPVQYWADLLDGKFSKLTSVGAVTRTVKRNTAAFDALIADTSFVTGTWIIDGEQKLHEHIEQEICEDFQLGWRLNGDGEVIPVDVRRKSSYAGTPTIGAADVTTEPPGWSQARGPLSRIDVETMVDSAIELREVKELGAGYPSVAPMLLRSEPHRLAVLEDPRSADLTREPHLVKAHAMRVLSGSFKPLTREVAVTVAKLRCEALAAELAQLFGFGTVTMPITCRITANTDAYPGEWRFLNLDEFPNAATNVRGGIRLALCLQREDHGLTHSLTFLDAGPDQVAVAPTIDTPTASGNVISVVVTVNAAVDPIEWHYAITDSSVGTRPAEASALWTYAGTAVATGTQKVERRGAGSRVWVRALSVASVGTSVLKRPSVWAFPAGTGYADVTALSAPSGVGVSNVAGQTADLAFTVGNADAWTEVYLDTGSGTPTSLVDELAPGSTKLRLRGLNLSTTHTVGVRHRDQYGGTSALVTETFATTGTPAVAPRPAGIDLAIA